MLMFDRLKTWSRVTLVGALFSACATTNGQGSETHFVSCRTDVECRTGIEACVASRCEPRRVNLSIGADGSVKTSTALGSGSGGAPGSSGGTDGFSVTHDSGVAGTVVAPRAPDASGEEFAYVYANGANFGTLYGVPRGTTSSVELDHGEVPPKNMAPPIFVARALTFDATSLYYSSEPTSESATRLVARPRSIGGAPRTLVSGLHMVSALAVDATSLYFMDRDPVGTGATVIGSVPLSGDSPDAGSYTKIVSQVAPMQWLAAYGDYVYWTATAGGGPQNPAGIIQRAPKIGGAIETIVTGVVNAGELYVDGSGVYWLDIGHLGAGCTVTDGDVRLLPSGSSTPVVLVSNLLNAASFVVTKTSLVVAQSDSICNVLRASTGNLLNVTLPSRTVTTIAAGVAAPNNLFFDGSAVYYTHAGDPANDVSVPAIVEP
jgi:hypothetical protein